MSALPPPLAVPPHYAIDQTRAWSYSPDQITIVERAAQWAREQQLSPAGAQDTSVHLLIIDAQRDFCFPQGTLYVGGHSGHGAMDDNARLAEWIYAHLGLVSAITATLDSHLAHQIFFAPFWVDATGSTPPDHTVISSDEVRGGRYRPHPEMARLFAAGDASWLDRQVLYYCEQLEKTGKYQLYLWPLHCLLGSEGHALAGVIQEACLFHAYTRHTRFWVETKGSAPLTENYSALRPEVMHAFDGTALGTVQTMLVERLLSADVVVVAGQASSHCVMSTIDDLLAEIQRRDRTLAGKVYLLADCMSAVTVPDGVGGFLVDFTPQADHAFARYREAGMHVVESHTDVEDWPEFAQRLLKGR